MEYSRRNFFRAGFDEIVNSLEQGLAALNSQSVSEEAPALPAVLRPPGALDEAQFLTQCSACDDCIKACPKQAIRKAGSEFGEELSGLPIILPATNPCWLCADLPCIEACETGALIELENREAVRMGTAVVDLESCYVAQSSICESCQDACPVRPRAIRVSFGSNPVVDHDLCTGCGVCAYLCPADAIEIQPLKSSACAD